MVIGRPQQRAHEPGRGLTADDELAVNLNLKFLKRPGIDITGRQLTGSGTGVLVGILARLVAADRQIHPAAPRVARAITMAR